MAAFVAPILGAGCALPDTSRGVDRSVADRADVERAVRAIIDADNAADLAAVLDCYTDDVLWIPPEDLPIRGRTAIEPRYRELFAAYQPRMAITIDDLQIEGDWAIARGGTEGELAPHAGGPAVIVHDNYLMLLRREGGGRWRISLLMWNKRASAEK